MHPMKAGFNKLIAHGVTGGVRSRLSGGSFKSGFLGSAVTAVNAPNMPCFKSPLLPIMPDKNPAA
jgi:hypothetical protein